MSKREPKNERLQICLRTAGSEVQPKYPRMAAILTGPRIKNDCTYPILRFYRAHISLGSNVFTTLSLLQDKIVLLTQDALQTCDHLGHFDERYPGSKLGLYCSNLYLCSSSFSERGHLQCFSCSRCCR
jgi:hypothetical protein